MLIDSNNKMSSAVTKFAYKDLQKFECDSKREKIPRRMFCSMQQLQTKNN